MKYILHFQGVGYTAPSADNPNGIKVKGKGHIVIEGERPKRAFDVPRSELERCRQVFMTQCLCVRMQGDEDGVVCFPTFWLGKALQ